MANEFDQFDSAAPQTSSGANEFDQFDSQNTVPPSDGGHGLTMYGENNVTGNTSTAGNNQQHTTVASPSSQSLSWGDVGSQALQNLIPSAIDTGKSIVTPFMHPVQTAENLGRVGVGEAEKLLPAEMQGDNLKYANALNSYFANRYGSMDDFKSAVARDPVGVATDLSVLFSGGGSLLAKAPGLVGKIGEAAADVGKSLNPVESVARGVGSVARPIGNVAAHVIGSLGTHTGAAPLKLALQAGYSGGDTAQAFLDNMRGNVPVEGVVNSAKAALGQLRSERGAAYRAGMSDVTNDKSILDFDNLDAALNNAAKIKTFKGVDIAPATADVRNEINGIVDHWKGLDPAEYHTPEGFDALKQRIGDLKDSLPYNTPQRTVASQAYNAVRGTIADQAPTYGKVMGDYERASDLIENIERTLSVNPRASVDTTLRKLQSIMRNNVNTNYGARANLAKVLTEHGAPNLEYELAGQALNKWTPRGLGGVEAGVPVIGALATGNVAPLAALPFMSPRLMGEAVYGMGRIGRGTKILQGIASGAGAGAPVSYEAAAPYRANGLEAYAKGGISKAAIFSPSMPRQLNH